MPIDPQAKELLDALAANEGPALSELPPDEARAVYEAFSTSRTSDDPLAAVDDLTTPGPAGDVPARLYRPHGEGPLPVSMFFHGGGFVLGNLRTHDALCRTLASRSGCAVVAVDYRLAPEHPFPAAVDDCYAATTWVADHAAELGLDADRLAVAGDSAGGNLAAVTSILARDRGGPTVRFQLLVYPVTDFSFSQPSYTENASGYFLTVDSMRWFSDSYVPQEADRTDPLAAPLLTDDLTGLPPALVITAEFDPLRDEGEAYADRLAAAGVPVAKHRYDGMIHGFVSMSALLDQGAAAVDECVEALRAAIGEPAGASSGPASPAS